MSGTDEKTFYLGLTMAGAISAGAYTAGVLDVLFEALDRHNQRYDARKKWESNNPGSDVPAELGDHPRHRVVLRVISGTSAGGVSAGLSVAGLIGARDAALDTDGLQLTAEHDGTYTSDVTGTAYSYHYKLKPLHYVWVEGLDLFRTTPEGKPEVESFLSTGDLSEIDEATGKSIPKAAVSALNTSHIDTAAATSLLGIGWNGGTYRFLPADLDLFLTTTNLQGVPYEVGFAPGTENAAKTHAMAQHSTIRHFRVSGLGAVPHRSAWLDAWKDEGINLPLVQNTEIEFDMPAASDTDTTSLPHADWRNWPKFKNAAIATGAFPVGLAPRPIKAIAGDFGIPDDSGATSGGAWPVDLLPGIPDSDLTPEAKSDTRPRPQFGPDTESATNTLYVAVDGGVANNEPFELARYTLRERITETDDGRSPGPGEKFLKSNPRDPKTANCAVLMVDPFPEGPTYSKLALPQAEAMRAIIPAALKLVPALINQARFKPGELIQATDKSVFSRFLLSPSRREAGAPRPERFGAKAIASGSFGGFGGFFHRSFRAHDYMLGQRNCRSFLKNHFKISAQNPILDVPATDPDAMVNVVNAGAELFDRDMPLPEWPPIGEDQLEPIIAQAEIRVRDVGASIVGFAKTSWFRKFVLGSVWSGALFLDGLDKAVSGALSRIMVSELIDRDQHIDYRTMMGRDGTERPFDEWERAVLVILAQSGAEPVPVVMHDSDRKRAEDKGEEIIELKNAIEGHSNVTEAELRAFLTDLARENRPGGKPARIWQAPSNRDDVDRYVLTRWKPSSTAWLGVTSLGGRLRNRWFGS